MNRVLHYWQRYSLALTIVSILLIFFGGYEWLGRGFYQGQSQLSQTTVLIPKGLSLHKLSMLLEEKKVIPSWIIFEVNVRLRRNSSKIKAGEYLFLSSRTPASVMLQMIEGRTVKRRITIIEGLKNKEIIKILMTAEGLEGDIVNIPEQGYLMPETYYYSYHDSRQAVLERMHEAMFDALEKAWNTRKPDLPLKDPREAIILASIVEKETALGYERPRVAAVFLNRLKKNMPLQADPTVSYGLEKAYGKTLERPLNRNDLTILTPYNTYMIQGLPPEPICNPGLASLKAVLNPMATADLYFVANGEGGHTFSPNYKEHQKHHQKLRALRKKEK
ncbi:endolytic transglycosylase MltG [Candidatus Nucleicultrix amoebiphila]|uniref:endolytic transglycosylase MltG n=1 Tax=Candidatus Nucleicultrix amoebiphila TaxID=1509244 RepID=UPI000A26B158|nr:endolytic transglycosylase MltG [Candidatus Nucleicultrix amoebiphila]